MLWLKANALRDPLPSTCVKKKHRALDCCCFAVWIAVSLCLGIVDMMAQLLDAKDKVLNITDTFDRPFEALGSTQYGIVPNIGAERSPAEDVPQTPPAAAPASWAATGSGHSGSPGRRPGYLRGSYAKGTAAELVARHAKQ